MSASTGRMRDDWRVTALGGLIAFVWAVSMIVDMVVASYDPPPSVHAVMIALATGVFAAQFKRGTDNGK